MWCDRALESRGRDLVSVRRLAVPEQGGAWDKRALIVINARNTILTYAETELVPVPVKLAVMEQGVEVVVAGGVF
ncbi:hypothetical protein V6N11_076957 [Hibiscus sabdariffa]|uniref:Uncharacterized protein n=1 Tax=Hibiscus sabdariffa TaxID=183260 RepID=A0ABR2TBM1_9ROSI